LALNNNSSSVTSYLIGWNLKPQGIAVEGVDEKIGRTPTRARSPGSPRTKGRGG
jgi:hypothetical protein